MSVKSGPAPRTVDKLLERLEETWWSIDPAVCRRLVEPMPRRIEAVIRARGGHTIGTKDCKLYADVTGLGVYYTVAEI